MPSDSVIKPMHPLYAYPQLTPKLIDQLTNPAPTQLTPEQIRTAAETDILLAYMLSGLTGVLSLVTTIGTSVDTKKRFFQDAKEIKAHNKEIRDRKKQYQPLNKRRDKRGYYYGPDAPIDMVVAAGRYGNFRKPMRPMSILEKSGMVGIPFNLFLLCLYGLYNAKKRLAALKT